MSERIVEKFGGRPGATAKSVGICMGLAEDSQANVVVVSAPGKLNAEELANFPINVGADVPPEFLASKVTDQLLAVRQSFVESGSVPSHMLESIQARYRAIIDGIDNCQLSSGFCDRIFNRVFYERLEEDRISMLGERIMAEIYQAAGWTMLEPSRFTAGSLAGDQRNNWRLWLGEEVDPNGRYVLPGNTYFDGQRLRTFGRGGSDISASEAAYGIRADFSRNNTDTTAQSIDPRIIRAARRRRHIGNLGYIVGRELGLNGVGLVHPDAMTPLMGTGIPTIIRDTFNPNGEITVMEDGPIDGMDGKIVAMSLMTDVSYIDVHEPGMSGDFGRVAHLAGAIAAERISLVDDIGRGADTQTFIVAGDDASLARSAIRKAMSSEGDLSRPNRQAMITFAGQNITDEIPEIREQLKTKTTAGEVNVNKLRFYDGDNSLRLLVPKRLARRIVDEAHALLIEQAA